MTKQDLIDSLVAVIFIGFMVSLFYGGYCYMKRVDAMVEQYHIELLNK